MVKQPWVLIWMLKQSRWSSFATQSHAA